MKKQILILIAVLWLSVFANIAFAETDTDGDGLTDYEENNIYYTSPDNPDSDLDGVSDFDEVKTYFTNPLRESTDGDYYDDGQELFGYSDPSKGGLGGQMPSYVLPPGNNVFVAAYPKIGFTVSDEFKIFLNKEIYFEDRIIESKEHTFGTITTVTYGTSVGEGGSHTTSEHQDTINKRADINYESEHSSTTTTDTTFSSEETTYGKDRTKVFNTGGSVKAGISLRTLGVRGEGHVSYTDTTKITEGETTFESQGHSVEITEGGETSVTTIFEETTESGAGKEETISSSMETTVSTSVSTVDLYTIGTAKEWANATTYDTSDWGELRFNFILENTGTDRTSGISDLFFTIEIGEYRKTYPTLTEGGISLPPLDPSESRIYSAEIPLRFEEIKAIDSGTPIEISIEDYTYGDGLEEAYAQSAYQGGVLFQIDDGVSDGDEDLEYYLVHREPGDTYLDMLKRLTLSVPVGSPQYWKNIIDIELWNDTGIYSIKGLPVSEWSYWSIKTEKLSNNSFTKKEAKPGSKVLMTYYKDTDHDYYNDRTEMHVGTDLNDPNSHPEPRLVVGAYEDLIESEEEFEVNYKLKFSNFGNYDAYGIEARLYSPDNSTTIIDEIAGGGVRVKAEETLALNDTLAWKISSEPTPNNESLALASKGAEAKKYRSLARAEAINDGSLDTFEYCYGYCGYVITFPEIYIINKTTTIATNPECEAEDCGAIGFWYGVYISLDGINWKLVSGNIEDDGVYGTWRIGASTETFEPTPAKYIKIYGRGAKINKWGEWNAFPLQIKELEAYGSEYKYTEPIIQVLYNDPQGPHRFLTPVKLTSLNDSLETRAGDMLYEPKLRATTESKYAYYEENTLEVVYLNPARDIEYGKLYVTYQLTDGTLLHSYKEPITYESGYNAITKTFRPSDYLADFPEDGKLIVLAVATDYQGIMLGENVEIVELEQPLKIHSFSPEKEVTINENELKEFSISASSASPLIYSWYFDGTLLSGETSNTYTYTTGFDSAGTHTLKAEVSDGKFTDFVEWEIIVNDVNRAPVLEPLEDVDLTLGETIELTPKAIDPDGDIITYTVECELDFTELNGIWTTIPETNGTYSVKVIASDGDLFDEESFSITIGDLNRAPILEPISDINVKKGKTITLAINATDPDGDALNYNLFCDLEFTQENEVFTISADEHGTYQASISVTDGNGGNSTQNFIINVEEDENREDGDDDDNEGSGGGGGGGSSAPPKDEKDLAPVVIPTKDSPTNTSAEEKPSSEAETESLREADLITSKGTGLGILESKKLGLIGLIVGIALLAGAYMLFSKDTGFKPKFPALK